MSKHCSLPIAQETAPQTNVVEKTEGFNHRVGKEAKVPPYSSSKRKTQLPVFYDAFVTFVRTNSTQQSDTDIAADWFLRNRKSFFGLW